MLPTELQLKSYHLPCKLFKKWKDLLSQYTNATYDDICQGVCVREGERGGREGERERGREGERERERESVCVWMCVLVFPKAHV